jgi:hypothetical protein
MSAKSNTDAADDSRRKIFIITAIASALLVALLVFWATRPGTGGAGQQPQLAGALREGTPEFALAREKIVIEPEPDEATESPRPAGDIVMTLRPKVRNFTGRTITGLELLATVVDLDERPVRQRTKIAVPNAEAGQAELENNKILVVPILMEGFRKEDVRANIRVVVTGVKFK